MMDLTLKDFINSFEFDYFESYSLQRGGEFEVYENLLTKLQQDENSLNNNELILLKSFKHSKLYKLENNSIFQLNNQLNSTAEFIAKISKNTYLSEEFIEIFNLPFIKFDAWMCYPIYRDAILFYDNKNNLINGLNICFQCLNIRTIENKELKTDRIQYQKLKQFLILLGHKIIN